MRFVRWYGSDQPIGGLGMRTLEGYLAEVEASGADSVTTADAAAWLPCIRRGPGLPGREAVEDRAREALDKERQDEGAIAEPVEREIIQLTPEGHAQLKDELDHLVNDMPSPSGGSTARGAARQGYSGKRALRRRQAAAGLHRGAHPRAGAYPGGRGAESMKRKPDVAPAVGWASAPPSSCAT